MQENTAAGNRYMQNRELSWLRFNRRVLEEAADTSVPLIERMKFIAIFSSNLDEFFMVRAGSLFDIAALSPDERDSKTGMTAMEQLEEIYKAVPDLITLKEKIYGEVTEELKKKGIEDVDPADLSSQERKCAGNFFRAEVLPFLSPLIIGPHHPVPHLIGMRLYVAALLEDRKGKTALGIIPLPENLPPYVVTGDGRYVRTENIVLDNAESLFGTYSVKELCIMTVTRNADISFDEEKFDDSDEDFRRSISRLLKKRDHLAVLRLVLDRKISGEFMKRINGIVNLRPFQVFIDRCPLRLQYVFSLPGDSAGLLKYAPFRGRWPEDIKEGMPVIPQVKKKDRLLFYPYDRVDPFLNLLSEAADDPDVVSIKITIYRLASSSKVAHILCRAAENGKDVLVLMELRARFDEANNLEWSRLLEEAGCQVIYGMEGFKCHSKICLITMKNRGRTEYITQIGTGNYNEKTNAMYTDLSLLTASEETGTDAALFFRNMLVNNLGAEYKGLCVSPFGIKDMICRNIEEQIKLGSEGYICIKVNSVTENEVIDCLRRASQAGVEIKLIVRGICCILPGVEGLTDNISVTSIVGRFLEHARIYMFGRGDAARVYISSADMMTRNLNRRVEIACPVRDKNLKEQLQWIMDTQLKDTAKASDMNPDGTYSRRNGDFDSQAYFMETSPHKASDEDEYEGYGFVDRILSWFK